MRWRADFRSTPFARLRTTLRPFSLNSASAGPSRVDIRAIRKPMRLLLYNPNTNQSLTAALAAAVRMRLAPRDALLAITRETGEAFVNSEDSIAGARASASATLRGPAGECDAILLGCFGDLGVDELRRELKRPIVSLSDAFLSVAPLAS